MEKNDNYFDVKSDAEKLRNVSSLVNDIVNSKPDDSLEVKESDTKTELVDLVGKAISTHKPNRGAFFQGVQIDDKPKSWFCIRSH